MSTQTKNLQLTKPDADDFYDISVFNDNADIIDEAIKEQEDTITELKKSVSDGKSLVANAITGKGVTTSTNATFQTMATNISNIQTNPTLQAKTVTLGTSAQTIKADSGYDGLSQVTVPGVSGTAVASNVLSGKTFSSASGIGLTGTMADNGAVSQTLNAGGSYTIPVGYHNGSGKVTTNTLANQTSATATAAQILNGSTAWVNGNKITGTIPILASAYNDQANATSTSYGTHSADGIPYLYFGIPSNSYIPNISWVKNKATDIASTVGLTADKLVSGNTILGISGTAIVGRRYASGSRALTTSLFTTINGYYDTSVTTIYMLEITGLGFTPSNYKILLTNASGSKIYGNIVYNDTTTIPTWLVLKHATSTANWMGSINKPYLVDTGKFAILLPQHLTTEGWTLTWEAWE